MVSLDQVQMISKGAVLDDELMRFFTMIGHSRIPVFT
jgi:CBS domain containing-hemolysin-like protein